jgi:hypothetical protein
MLLGRDPLKPVGSRPSLDIARCRFENHLTASFLKSKDRISAVSTDLIDLDGPSLDRPGAMVSHCFLDVNICLGVILAIDVRLNIHDGNLFAAPALNGYGALNNGVQA